MINFATSARVLSKNGYTPIPVVAGEKYPTIKNWTNINYAQSPELLGEYCTKHPDASTGILLGDVCVIDIDVLDEQAAKACSDIVVSKFGEVPCRIGKAPKSAYFFRVEGNSFSKLRTAEFKIDGDKAQVEFLCDGQQVVVFGEHPHTKKPYSWCDKSLLDVDISQLPTISESEAQGLKDKFEQQLGYRTKKTPERRDSKAPLPTSLNAMPSMKVMEEALSFIDPQVYDEWIAVGHALKSGGEQYLPLFRNWSKIRPDGSTPNNYKNEQDIDKSWSTFKPSRTSLRSIFRRAEAAGGVPQDQPRTDLSQLIAEMNKEWFVTFENGKVFVCRKKSLPFGSGKELEFFTSEEFHKALSPLTIEINGKTHKQSRLWFDHSDRREYQLGTICDPSGTVPAGYYNTWQGFAVSPNHHEPSLMIDHIENVIADGNKEYANYVKGWLAMAVQKPELPAGTALVLRGRQGTGKGVLGTTMIRIFGSSHSKHIEQAGHLVGRFQSHLENCLFLYADEAFFPGDPKIKGQLKSLITERFRTLEAKYRAPKMVQNHLSILMASNEDFVVPAELEDRRFVVLDVSNKYEHEKPGREKYFDALWDSVEGDRLGGFLNYLLEYDLSTFNIRKIPATLAKTEQKLHMLKSGELFCYWALQRGSFYIPPYSSFYLDAPGTEHSWQEFRSTQYIYECYEHWHRREHCRQRKLDQANFAKILIKFGDKKRPSGDEYISVSGSKANRPSGYWFGDLDTARSKFSISFNLANIIWDDPNSEPLIEETPF